MKYGLIIIGLLLLVSSASATDAWWNTSYQYRVPITLTGNTSGAQTDYQLLLDVPYISNMQSGFNDLRFTDDSGNLVNAWLENKTDDSNADIWVNFTTIPDNGITQTYYMYYGNTEVSNYWNGTNTFIFFDDFEYNDDPINHGWTLITGTYNTNYNTDTAYAKRGSRSLKLYPASAVIVDLKHTISSISEVAIDVDYYEINDSEISIYTGLEIVSPDERLAMYGTYYNVLYSGAWQNSISASNGWHKFSIKRDGINVYFDVDDSIIDNYANSNAITEIELVSGSDNSGYNNTRYYDSFRVRKYVVNPPTYEFDTEEEYTPPPTPTPTSTPTPTPLPEIISANYVIQNQTLYITKPSNIQYKITSNSFVYGGLRNINTIICDNNNTVISGWFKVSTDKVYDCDYTFLINVNDTSYESKIVTLKQEQVGSSIISKIYKRTCLIDGYEIYSYNTTIYIVSILPNPIYFYFNLEDRTIQFGDKQFNNQTLVFNQLNFDDQYKFMNNASSDTIVMKFKAINPSIKSGAELKGLTGLVLNAMSKVPLIGKSLKNIVYYPLFFIQTLFNFIFTFLDIIVNDWWYGLMLLEIVCIFAASRNTGYANVMEVYIDTHVKIIKFIYEWIILNMVNLIIKLISLIMELARTVKDMIKWW